MNRSKSPFRLAVIGMLLAVASVSTSVAQETSRLDQVLNQIVEREQALAANLQQYQPLIETYLQTVRPDPMLGTMPVRDNYFIGRLNLEKELGDEKSKKAKRRSTDQLLELFSDFYMASFKPDGFARMLILDGPAFTRENYTFDFVRREFLGEVRTLVFDVTPVDTRRAVNGSPSARFTGRIWVEDKDYSIVRYNGVYASLLWTNLHFDSWRLNMAPGLWLPAYVYSEEDEKTNRKLSLKHKGQTRIWGYDTKGFNPEDEFTKVMIDSDMTDDRTETPGSISPVKAVRAWEREAEDNVITRLERSGLLATEGEVSQVLETVVANLEVTNELNIQPPIRCRVLLTTPLESFSIGHTIVLSRGLIDVLPDEASLAMVLAHEMGHVISGHQLDTRYAFSDAMLIGDRQTMEEFYFKRAPEEDLEADRKAVELLQNSPYKDDLSVAGLFLKELLRNADSLPNLIRPHFGNRMADGNNQMFRLKEIYDAAPELEPTSIEQISALPLGSRVKVDPWRAGAELMKNNAVALLSAREKLPFQVTPLMPHLARFNPAAGPASAQSVNPAGSTDSAGVASNSVRTAGAAGGSDDE